MLLTEWLILGAALAAGGLLGSFVPLYLRKAPKASSTPCAGYSFKRQPGAR